LKLRAALYVALGCAVYAAWLIATWPASWVAERVERASRGVLELRGPAGSLWSGAGRLYARRRNGALVNLGALRWRVLPARLLAGRLAATLTLAGGAKPVRVERSFSGWRVRDLDFRLPAATLGSFAPALDALEPQGRIALRSADLRIDARSVLGLAELEWRDMRLAPAKGIDLGSYRARLRGGGARVDIELGSIDGPLRLSGGGSWAPGGKLSIAGTAEHDAHAAPALIRFLQGMCGEYRVNTAMRAAHSEFSSRTKKPRRRGARRIRRREAQTACMRFLRRAAKPSRPRPASSIA